MNAGIYRSTTGLLVEEQRLTAIADNLANSNMPGYKRTVTTARPFVSAFHDAMSNINTPEDGVRSDVIPVDFTQGPLRVTERPLDFAIEGDGFFTVTKGDQTFYTRNGAFELGPDGELYTSDGLKVGGTMNFPQNVVLNNISIEPETGILRYGTQEIGTIDLVRFEDLKKMKKIGPGLFTPTENMLPESPAEGNRVLNRTLEGSNTMVFREMAELIMCTKNFEACQKMTSMQDSIEGQLINKTV